MPFLAAMAPLHLCASAVVHFRWRYESSRIGSTAKMRSKLACTPVLAHPEPEQLQNWQKKARPCSIKQVNRAAAGAKPVGICPCLYATTHWLLEPCGSMASLRHEESSFSRATSRIATHADRSKLLVLIHMQPSPQRCCMATLMSMTWVDMPDCAILKKHDKTGLVISCACMTSLVPVRPVVVPTRAPTLMIKFIRNSSQMKRQHHPYTAEPGMDA